MPRFLNLGCGSCFSTTPEWTNLDKTGNKQGVVAHDVYKPLPFVDGEFDAVYHSDLLEHLYKRFAPLFMAECYRVLKRGGVLRVAIPDLEQACRLYLDALAGARAGDAQSAARYRWLVVELVDQMTRHRSGGEMLNYWTYDPMPAEAFVIARCGQEVIGAIHGLRKSGAVPLPDPGGPTLGEMDAAAVGKFRLSGQAHLWMYDSYSLGELFNGAGFRNVRQCVVGESAIPNWASYNLDTMPDGSVRKPDSIYMEGVK